MADRQQVAMNTARELLHATADASFDAETFAMEVRCDHRTSQQNTARVVFALIKQWASDYDKRHYDLRNEDTVRTCKDIVEGMPDIFLRHI